MMRMISILLVVFGLMAPAVAKAGHCYEVSTIVGYERCRRYGNWGFGVRLSLEVGATALRVDGDAIDETTNSKDGTRYHFMAAPGDDRPLTAAGVRFRPSIGIGRTFYFTPQFDVASITGGPRLVSDVSAHGATTMMTASSAGILLQYAMLFGLHRWVGPVSLALEVGPGIRVASFTPGDEAWFVLQAQPVVDVWLTPNVSLGVQAGTDLLDHSTVSAGLTLGLHATPYDMAR
jgi:hypothetical protein